MNVAQILQVKGPTVHSVYSDQTSAEAVSVLNAQNIGAVVVLDRDEKVVGIVSERDIVRRLEDDRFTVLAAPVANTMTAKPIVCDLESTLDDMLEIMTQSRIRHLPIVHEQKLVGLLSIGDLVKLKIRLIENEAAALRDYIAT